MRRRGFLVNAGKILLTFATPALVKRVYANMPRLPNSTVNDSDPITLFLCGDVMTGRGIDQILPHPVNPTLYEPFVKNALSYVGLAEARNGPIDKPVDFAYVWGDALQALSRLKPDVRIINLETAVTTSDDYVRGKGINYRMHPKNIPCLTAAQIDCCVLANNHVLDWGYPGLTETLKTLQDVNIQTAGAGEDIDEAEAPAIMDVAGKGRVIVYSFGHESSGVGPDWGATKKRPGVNLLKDFSSKTIGLLASKIKKLKQPRDIVVISIHWGGNWGYAIPPEQRRFARNLIDEAGCDIIYCHSSHHPKGIEVYHHKPIFYGCGDFLNDYEGISGYEAYRDDLSLMYFVNMDAVTGRLTCLHMIPNQIKRFRLNRATRTDAKWLCDVLNREGKKLGTGVETSDDNSLILYW